MPSRNVIKNAVPDAYYHVYSRGANKQSIFITASDYRYFMGLLERYLGEEQQKSKAGVLYPHHRDKIKLLAYCLMSNHIHLLVYQSESSGLEKFMRSLMTSYSRYFNLRYKRSGPLFEGRYRAVLVDNDQYLQHISRYIHLNPKAWQDYEYSSYKCYICEVNKPSWLSTELLHSLFSSVGEYRNFTSDYEGHKQAMSEVKQGLADF